MNELKCKSQASFEVMSNAQSSFPDIQQLRDTVSDAMQSASMRIQSTLILTSHRHRTVVRRAWRSIQEFRDPSSRWRLTARIPEG